MDEAHLLAAYQLEELRLLTNADMDSHSAFACLLVGPPTLRRRIKLGTFAALDQRIALRFAMPPMTPAETTTYIAHHLSLAGRADTLFLRRRHRPHPPGLPRPARAVNNLAIQALVAAYAIVDESSARVAVTETTAWDVAKQLDTLLRGMRAGDIEVATRALHSERSPGCIGPTSSSSSDGHPSAPAGHLLSGGADPAGRRG